MWVEINNLVVFWVNIATLCYNTALFRLKVRKKVVAPLIYAKKWLAHSNCSYASMQCWAKTEVGRFETVTGNQCKRAIIRRIDYSCCGKVLRNIGVQCLYSFKTVWAQRLYIIIIMIIIEWLSQEVSHTGRDKEEDTRSESVMTHALAITSSEQRLI